MTYMTHAIGKLGFQANVARCIQFDARLLLLLGPLPDRVLQRCHLFLFPPTRGKAPKKEGEE